MKFEFKVEKRKFYHLSVAMVLMTVLYFQVEISPIALLLFAVAFFLLDCFSLQCEDKYAWEIALPILGLSSYGTAHLVQYLLLEEEIREKLSDTKFTLNVICAVAVFVGVQTFFRKVGTACIVSYVFLMLLAGVNYYVFLFRGNEFIFSDIRSIQTGLSVAGNYSFTLDEREVYVIYLSVLYVLLMMHIKAELTQKWIRPVICVSLSVLAVCYVGSETKETVTETWEQKGSYRNGYLLNFALSIRDFFVAEPEGYSAEAVEAIEQLYENGDASGDADDAWPVDGLQEDEKPTVIVIMSESYADLRKVGKFSGNIDVTPFYDSLTENTLKGYALSSVFGAKTSNSEWEFLTGNSMAFLPSGSVIYQQYISEEPYSLVSEMKDEGYTCVAMHPYYETGWSRNRVYPNMGFDEMFFIEDFDQTQILREYVTDQEFYETIIERFEKKASNEELFVMGISMQNHGGYKDSYDNFTEEVRVLGYNYSDANQYASLLHESDKALEYLITYFEAVEEPVEILFFGDHLPSLDTNYYKTLNGKGLSGLDLTELQALYTVPFFIWTNYDTPEETVEISSLNYLSTLALQRAGIELPAYNDFLADMMEVIPAINARGYYSAADECYKYFEDATGEEEEWLKKYEILQYNSMFDKKEQSDVFFD